MNATLAPRHWPAAPGPAGAWRFGREVQLANARPALQWVLKRNCAITPGQLGAVYGSLCAVSLAIAAMFWWQGAPFVLGFASLELLLVGAAMLVYARHAGDRDTITVQGQAVEVEQTNGRHHARTEFRAEWLSVEPAAGQGSLVELAGQGQRVRVGRFVRPELRHALAQELRLAMRRVRQHEDTPPDAN